MSTKASNGTTRRELLKPLPRASRVEASTSTPKAGPEAQYTVKSAVRSQGERILELAAKHAKNVKAHAKLAGAAAMKPVVAKLGATSPHADEPVLLKPKHIANYKYDGTDIPAGSTKAVYVPTRKAVAGRGLGLFDKLIFTKNRTLQVGAAALTIAAVAAPFAIREVFYGDSEASASTKDTAAKICTTTERTPIGAGGSLKTVLGEARVSNGQLAHVQVERHSEDLFPAQPDKVLETVPAGQIIESGQATQLQPHDVVLDVSQRAC